MAALPKEALPQPLDIVWARFPYSDNPGVPAQDPHPALVFSTFEYAPGLFSVQVAYGTSKLKTDTRPFDFRVQNFRVMQYAGLHQATRFDLDRVKFLMWDDAWFFSPDPEKYDTPVIGHLLDEAADRLRNILRVRADHGYKVPYRPATDA